MNEQVSKLLFSAKSALSDAKSVPSAVREPVKRAFSDVSFALDTINHRLKQHWNGLNTNLLKIRHEHV